MRLIDADYLDEKMGRLANRYALIGKKETARDYNFVRTVLETAPTMDAEIVVRCKDCKFALTHPFNANQLVCSKPINWRAIEPNHFCSYGERREGE